MDFNELNIPLHRIVYFKYKDTKVWDKSQRLDLIFSSTVFQADFKGKTIDEVIQIIDDRYKQLNCFISLKVLVERSSY